MSTNSEDGEVRTSVRTVIEQVLMVPVERIRPEAELVRDLGAESIDFLDLLFGLEDALGLRLPPELWTEWVAGRLPDLSRGQGITVAIVEEFALERMADPGLPGGPTTQDGRER